MARNNPASSVALGGVFAALAVVIMCLGGMIPLATFICPMLCMVLLEVVRGHCGGRIGWAWYGAVAILGVLLGPDKEAAATFVFLGYYPLIKPKLDSLRLKWLLKVIYFNMVILVMYWLLIHLFGMEQLLAEFSEMGIVLLLVTLLMGNLTFFLLDKLLKVRFRQKR